jgi:hypothetical protein
LKVDPAESRLYKLRRKIFAWAELFDQVRKDRAVSFVFQGVTYRPGEDWKPNDIRDYILGVKDLVGRDGVMGYSWVGEMQARGVPHYHLLWAVDPAVYLPFPDKSGLWAHGSSKVSSREHMQGKPFYLCKYLSKLNQKTAFPKGFRLFGVNVRRGLVSDLDLWHFRMTNYPKWLYYYMLGNGFQGVTPKRVPGGGWEVDGKYGVVVYSDWLIEGMPALIDDDRVLNK